MVAGTCLHLCSRKMSTQVAVPVSKQTLIKGDTDDMVTLTGNHFLGRWCHWMLLLEDCSHYGCCFHCVAKLRCDSYVTSGNPSADECVPNFCTRYQDKLTARELSREDCERDPTVNADGCPCR